MRGKSLGYLYFNGTERLRLLLLFVMFEVKVTCHPDEREKFRLPLSPVEVLLQKCEVSITLVSRGRIIQFSLAL